MSFTKVPEIDVHELARKLKSDAAFTLLDVRELGELNQAKITDSRLQVVPMSRLAQLGVGAMPEEIHNQDVEILVLCHHGIRSAQVTKWLQAQGWTNAYNVRGGIDEFAKQVDVSVGMY